MVTVAERLQGLICDYWRLPEGEGRVLLRRLCTSQASRAVALRQHLALGTHVDTRHLFAEIITPAYLVQLLADLRAAGQLTTAQVRTIERCVLACVDRQGQWRPVEEE